MARWTGPLRLMADSDAPFKVQPDDTPSNSNDKLTAFLHQLKERHIPILRPRSNPNDLPWMRKAKIKRQRKEKWRHWRKFKESQLPRDYDAYKRERNRLVDMTRTAKLQYEKGLIDEMKTNPNVFHGHCRRLFGGRHGASAICFSLPGPARTQRTQ